MESKKLKRIIDVVREEMMTTGSTPGKPGFSSKADAAGPTAGFDPVMGKMMKRKKALGVWSRSLRGKNSASK